MEPMLFGQILLNFNLVNEVELRRCLLIQSQLGFTRPLGEILIEENLIDAATLANILSVQKREVIGQGNTGITQSEMSEGIADGSAESFLKLARKLGASDVYLTSGKRPMVRLHGALMELPADHLDPLVCAETIFSLLTAEQQLDYDSHQKLDFCTELSDGSRYRVNVFTHRDGIGAVIRVLSQDVRTLEELGVPPVVSTFAQHRNGLVLITGSTGSGKTTTLGALINQINTDQERHIITLEDPIEMGIQSARSFVTQREVGTHTRSFAEGLRAALREDPDVIVVGELRDPETFAVALTAAETGHLVFGTLHTRSAHSTIARVIDQFPANQRSHIRTMLAGSLRAVLCQELVPVVDSGERVLATEVMTNNQAIANLIRENRGWQIPNIMQTSGSAGMHLLDDSLERLVRTGKITLEDAVDRANDRSRFLVPG